MSKYSSQPFRCPVCNGRGQLAEIGIVDCRACKGTGIVWTPLYCSSGRIRPEPTESKPGPSVGEWDWIWMPVPPDLSGDTPYAMTVMAPQFPHTAWFRRWHDGEVTAYAS